MLEFGARSTGEPCEMRPIRCDAAHHLPGVVFPTANPRVMRPERTFCVRNELFGRKPQQFMCFARKGNSTVGIASRATGMTLHDSIEQESGKLAIADRALSLAVARHKAIFFAEKDSAGTAIDYQAAVTGALQLVPHDKALESLSLDYAQMVEDGLLLDDAEPFGELLDHCRELQERANRMN